MLPGEGAGAKEYLKLIDYLKLRLPDGWRCTAHLERLATVAPVIAGKRNHWFRDLRPHGAPVTLHEPNCAGGDRFISIHRVADLSATNVVRVLTELVKGDVLALPIVRVDFAADVADLPVSWFFERAWALNKRRVHYFGRFARKRGPSVESFAFGSHGGRFSIYDKRLEMSRTLARSKRRNRYDADLAARLRQAPRVLTRIEVQTRRDHLPPGIVTLRDLFGQSLAINPFSGLALLHGGPISGKPAYSPAYYRDMALLNAIEMHGVHIVRKHLNSSGRNAHRVLSALRQSARVFNVDDLVNCFRQSILAHSHHMTADQLLTAVLNTQNDEAHPMMDCLTAAHSPKPAVVVQVIETVQSRPAAVSTS